jgi:hypothetical protein
MFSFISSELASNHQGYHSFQLTHLTDIHNVFVFFEDGRVGSLFNVVSVFIKLSCIIGWIDGFF